VSTATVEAPTPTPKAERRYKSYSAPFWRRALFTREFAVIALLIAVIIWSDHKIPFFSGPLTMYFLFMNIAPILLIALPMTMVIITGEIDLSVASTVGLSSVAVGMLHHDAHWSIPLAALGAVIVGIVAGAVNGFLVAYVGLPSLAVTIGTLALYRGIATGLLGTEAITDFPAKWTQLTEDKLAGTNYPVVVVPIAVLAVIFAILLHFTVFGRGVFEIGLNPEAARFSGVNIARTKMILFILSGGVSAMAGVYYTLHYGSAAGDNATGMELNVIAAVLLGGVSIFGGRGALHGVIAGVILIGVISSAMTLDNYKDNQITIVTGVLLVLSVMSTSLLARAKGLRPARWLGALGFQGRRKAAIDPTTEASASVAASNKEIKGQ
jgi:rhamnose transport system permease protein